MIKTKSCIHISSDRFINKIIFAIVFASVLALTNFTVKAENKISTKVTNAQNTQDTIDRKKIQTANVDRAMKYYKEHNMDVFSELVQSGIPIDPNAKEEDIAKIEKIDEEKYAKGELLSDSARLSAINQAKVIFSKVQSNKMKAELLARMGSLSYKRAKTSAYFEMNKYKVKTIPGYKLEPSTKMYKEAIRNILEIEKYNPNYEKLDRMYFEAAICHEEIKERNKAFNLYKDIERRFPNSEILPDSLLAMGEYLFDNKRFDEAITYFNKILRHQDTKLHILARYKIAWAQFNTSDVPAALSSMKEVIRMAKNSKLANSRLGLKQEALNDIVFFFADFDDYTKSYDLFYEVTDGDKKETETMLFNLVRTYVNQGKHNFTYKAARFFRNKFSNSDNTLSTYKLSLEALEAIKLRHELVVEVNSFSQFFIKAIGDNENKIQELTECLDTLAAFATSYHKEYLSTKMPETAELSKAFYEKILLIPANRKNIKFAELISKIEEKKYYFAELLFEIKEYENADKYFESVFNSILAKTYIANEQRHEEAGLGRIASLENFVEKQKKQKVDIKNSELKLLNALDEFAKNLPNSKKTQDIQYKGILIANTYALNDIIFRITSYITKYPEDEKTNDLALNALDNLITKAKWQESYKLSKALYEKPKLSGATKNKMLEVHYTSKFNFANEEAKKGNKKQAALLLESLYDEITDAKINNALISKIGINAIKNASAIYKEIEDPDNAERILAKVDDEESILLLTKIHLDRHNYSHLLIDYERFLTFHKQSKKASEIAFNQGLIFEMLNDNTKALTSYRISDSVKAHERILDILLEEKKTKEAISEINLILQKPINEELRLKLFYYKAKILNDTNEDNESVIKAAKKIKPDNKAEKYWKGKITVLEAINQLYEFKDFRFTKTNANPDQNILKKTRMMESLKAEIKKLAKAQNIEADVYVHKLMYESMYELSYTIENAAVPAFITQEKDQKLFKGEMKKVADSILEQGKVNLENCKSIINENMLREDNFDSCDSRENKKIAEAWSKISVADIRPKTFRINNKTASNCDVISYHVSRGRYKIVDIIPDANKCSYPNAVAVFEKAIHSNQYINQELILNEVFEDFKKFAKTRTKDINNLNNFDKFINEFNKLYLPTK